jgi:ABC-type antimicrobial peptide transport system permease subunit
MKKLMLIAGPCAIETEETVLYTAERLKEISDELDLDFYFKALSSYQDYDAMNNSILETRSLMLIISVAILIIVLLMMSVIRIHETERRKFEVSILKANGMTKRETHRMILIESFWEAIKILLIAFVFTCGLALLTNAVLFGQELILINGKLIAALCGIAVLSVVAPSIITIVFTNRYEPDKILRGK